MLARYGALVLFIGFLAAPAFGQLTSYHIGNSLTWDTQPGGFADKSAQRGITHDVGYHIRCSKSLPYIVGHPTETCVDPTDTGKWADALPNNAWDVVTMQVHPSDGSHLATDVAAILTFIDSAQSHTANSNTRFIVYGAWPRTYVNWSTDWLEPIDPTDPNTSTRHSRPYQETVYRQVQAARPGATVEFLSIGDLLFLADQRIREAVAGGGDWFGFTDVDQLYRDQIHLGHGTGRLLASDAMWAAVTGEDPLDLLTPESSANEVGLATFVSESMSQITSVPEPTSGLLALAGLTCIASRRVGRAALPR